MTGRHAAYPVEYEPRHCGCVSCELSSSFHFQHIVETSAVPFRPGGVA